MRLIPVLTALMLVALASPARASYTDLTACIVVLPEEVAEGGVYCGFATVNGVANDPNKATFFTTMTQPPGSCGTLTIQNVGGWSTCATQQDRTFSKNENPGWRTYQVTYCISVATTSTPAIDCDTSWVSVNVWGGNVNAGMIDDIVNPGDLGDVASGAISGVSGPDALPTIVVGDAS